MAARPARQSAEHRHRASCWGLGGIGSATAGGRPALTVVLAAGQVSCLHACPARDCARTITAMPPPHAVRMDLTDPECRRVLLAGCTRPELTGSARVRADLRPAPIGGQGGRTAPVVQPPGCQDVRRFVTARGAVSGPVVSAAGPALPRRLPDSAMRGAPIHPQHHLWKAGQSCAYHEEP